MKNLIIEKNQTSPHIVLNADENIIKITGDSFPENSFEFYEPILEWMTMYFAIVEEETNVELTIPYLNSSSLKVLFSMFLLFEKSVEKNKKINITWYYDKENDMSQEDGEEFKESFDTLNMTLKVKD